MARRAKIKSGDKLPNAPLVEAVFEMHWALKPSPGMPVPNDPGLLPTLEGFTRRVTKMGFPAMKDMGTPDAFVAPNTIARRFYQADDRPFPLLQLGPGIYASNQSTNYEWVSFKKQTLTGLKHFVASYPRMEGYPLMPSHLELRYIDAFDEGLVGTADLAEFLSSATDMKLTTPSYFASAKLFQGRPEGRIALHYPLKKLKSSLLVFDIGTGARSKDDKTRILRLETKVISKADDVPKFDRHFSASVAKWLETAHNLLSPLFKSVVSPDVMKKFERK